MPDSGRGAIIRDTSPVPAQQSGAAASGAESFSRSRPHSEVKAVAALRELLLEAQLRLRLEQWWRAIDVAERGLRIDRRQSSFYEILAAAYTALGDPGKASQFALEGRRYCNGAEEGCAGFDRYLGAD